MFKDFGYDEVIFDSRVVVFFEGGEIVGLECLCYYLWEIDLVKDYKEICNGLIGSDYFSKFLVWLVQGCLLLKMIYYEFKKYEVEWGVNKSIYWFFFELFWCDFFCLMGKKYEEKIFLKGGIKDDVLDGLCNNWQYFCFWLEGEIGVFFIDVNMWEFNLMGFMLNWGCQNVVSFLVKDLKINWQMGVEYFELMFIDYDVMSNWGNWNYVVGVGSDLCEDCYFNIVK